MHFMICKFQTTAKYWKLNYCGAVIKHLLILHTTTQHLDYKHITSINFENISLLVSGCTDLLANKKCAQVAWTYLDCHFVLRLHEPIWLEFCTQVTWTYTIAILCSGCTDLYPCNFVLRLHGWLTYMIGILHSGCMDLYDWHFALRSHGPIPLPFCAQVAQTYIIAILCSGCMDDLSIWLPFCTQATWTYMIAILCSCHTDLYHCHFVLRLHTPIQSAFCAQVTGTYFACVSLQMPFCAQVACVNLQNLAKLVCW